MSDVTIQELKDAKRMIFPFLWRLDMIEIIQLYCLLDALRYVFYAKAINSFEISVWVTRENGSLNGKRRGTALVWKFE